jgi:hypothetical protein
MYHRLCLPVLRMHAVVPSGPGREVVFTEHTDCSICLESLALTPDGKPRLTAAHAPTGASKVLEPMF